MGVTVMAVHRRHRDVEGLARRHEMNPEFAATLSGFDHVRPKLEHWISERGFLIAGEEPMAIEFDKGPVGPALDGDARVSPPVQPRFGQWVSGGQRPVIDSWPGQSVRAAAPVEDQG